MSQIVPLDVDGINNDFDNKENSLRHSNICRTPCKEKGYEDLDVSELNMKLRYSITPASSPLSKSLTSCCIDNRSINNDDPMNNVVMSENCNLTRSLNSTITGNDTKRSTKSLPLQALTNDHTSENRSTSVLCSLNSKPRDTNLTITLNGMIDNDDNVSLPSTPSPVIQTPEAITPTKEVIKHDDSSSPILRGLKSVLNLFRTSQSPVPVPEDKSILDPKFLSPIDGKDVMDSDTQSILASTPIATKHKVSCDSKRSSPLKESITFSDDLENELQWKDDTTILFKEDKIPIRKLFPAHFLHSSPKTAEPIMVTSITEQNTSVNTSLEYMDVSNNNSVLVNKVTTNTRELQEILSVESDGEFVDCETTVNYEISCNGEGCSNDHDITIQCVHPRQDKTLCSDQLTVNNSPTITKSNPPLEDDLAMTNSNLPQVVQQGIDVFNQVSDTVVDKQKQLESKRNYFIVPQNSNKLLGSDDINYERFNNEMQNICNNMKFNEIIDDGLDFVSPNIKSTLQKDGFQISDNINKDCDQVLTPSEVPLPDEDEGENDTTLEKIVVSTMFSENTTESLSEKESILDIDQMKLVSTESHRDILQKVYSENPITMNENCNLIHNLSSDNTNVLEYQIISSNLNSTDFEQKILDESKMISNGEKIIDIGLYVTSDQNESLKVINTDHTERLIMDHPIVVLDQMVYQDLIKTICPCPKSKCECIHTTSLNLIETPKNIVNVQDCEEVTTEVINSREDKNLEVFSKALNEISEQVNARDRSCDMSLNLNNNAEKLLFAGKPENVIASEHTSDVICKGPHSFQQNDLSLPAPDKYGCLTSSENLDKYKIENICTDNHLSSSTTVSEIMIKSVNNKKNCGKEIQNAVLNKCEELINIPVKDKEQTNQTKDEINVIDVVYTENQVTNSVHVDNDLNKKVIKDLNIVNESTIRNMNMSPLLSSKNVCASYNLDKIDDPFCANCELQNTNLHGNNVCREHTISDNYLEQNIETANNDSEQGAHVLKLLHDTNVAEEVSDCLFVNNMDRGEEKLQKVQQKLSTSSKILTLLLEPDITSKVHLDEIDNPFATKPKTQNLNFTEKISAHVNAELWNCKEQININVIETEGMTNYIKPLETQAVKDILNVLPSDYKINTEEGENYMRHVITKEIVESPPLSPEISCEGYNFNFILEDPFRTKSKIRMSPPPVYTTTPLAGKEKNSKNSDQLSQHESVQRQDFRPAYETKENSVTTIDSVLSSLNKRSSQTKNKGSLQGVGEAGSNDNIFVDSSVDNSEKVVDNDAVNRNMEVSDCQTVVNLNKEEDMSVDEKGVLEELYKTRREVLSHEDGNTCFGSQNTDDIVNYQTKNVFNLPEMSGVFISKSHPLTSESDKAVAGINVFDNRTEGDHDIKVEVENKSLLASTVPVQDAADDDVNTEDEDTIEGPFFESAVFSHIDKITDQDDMIKFADMSSRQVPDDIDNGEMFIDAEAFDFLLNQNKSNVVTDSGKESLFLKFDPLFAKRMSSDGILNALNEVKKRPGTPKNILKTSALDITYDKTCPGPSTSNMTTEIRNTLDSSFEDPNFMVSKPMMVVNPAINSCSPLRNKSCTPPRENRRSLTFTSPAIAVIDRLLSLSSNNSPLNHDTSNTRVHREPNEADLALSQLRELLAEKELHVQNLRTESKELKNRLSTLESQVKKVESESGQKLRKINELNESLAEKTKLNKSMTVVLEEYERTMASLIAEIEQDKKRHAEERTQLKNERNEQTAHLASMELAFNDLHSKYEKSKQIIMSCKANEEIYKKSIEEFQENLLKMQKNYEQLKQHATSQLNHANREFDRMKRAHEAEILKLNAMVKRKEVDICSLEETLAQKIKTNEELAAICDDLINKVG